MNLLECVSGELGGHPSEFIFEGAGWRARVTVSYSGNEECWIAHLYMTAPEATVEHPVGGLFEGTPESMALSGALGHAEHIIATHGR